MLEEYEFKNFIYDDENIQVLFHLIPKCQNEIGKKCSRVIVEVLSKEWKDDSNGIIKSIIKKSSRYGDMNKPYIICVNTFTGTCFNPDDVLDKIYGSSCQYEDQDEIFRLDNGFFGSAANKKHTRVSGVMINNLMDANLLNANYLLCKHPYSINDLDFNNIGLDYYSIIENKVFKTAL